MVPDALSRRDQDRETEEDREARDLQLLLESALRTYIRGTRLEASGLGGVLADPELCSLWEQEA